MPRRTMTMTRIWYHPLRKTKMEDWGLVGELPDKKDLADLFEKFVQSDVTNDTLVRPDRESYAVVTNVERKNRALTVTFEAGRFGEKGVVKNVKTHQPKGDFTPEDATVVVTHGVLLVPTSGKAALVFSERSNGQGGMTALLPKFVERFNLLYPEYRMKTATVVQTDAWLKRARLTKIVGTVRKYNTDEATDNDEQIIGELTHTLLPERDRRYFPDSIWRRLRDQKINRAKFLNFPDDTQLDTLDVTASDGTSQRTFEIGDEKTPPLRLILTSVGETAFTSEKILKRALDEAADIFTSLGIEWSETDAVAAPPSS